MGLTGSKDKSDEESDKSSFESFIRNILNNDEMYYPNLTSCMEIYSECRFVPLLLDLCINNPECIKDYKLNRIPSEYWIKYLLSCMVYEDIVREKSLWEKYLHLIVPESPTDLTQFLKGLNSKELYLVYKLVTVYIELDMEDPRDFIAKDKEAFMFVTDTLI